MTCDTAIFFTMFLTWLWSCDYTWCTLWWSFSNLSDSISPGYWQRQFYFYMLSVNFCGIRHSLFQGQRFTVYWCSHSMLSFSFLLVLSLGYTLPAKNYRICPSLYVWKLFHTWVFVRYIFSTKIPVPVLFLWDSVL